MKVMIWTALVLLAVVGCSSVSEDQRFEELGQRYLDEFTALSPVSATFLGDHRFDSELDHVNEEVRDTERQFLEQTLADLGRINRDQLSRANQVDALLLENKLEEDLWRLQVLQEWAWNPTRYTGLSGGSLYSLLARDYAPLEERLVHVSARLEQFPRLFEEIRATLVPERVPQIHAETAVSQNPGALSILDNQVVPHLDVLADDERARLERAMDTGRAAVEEHQRWLEEELLPAARGEFRIGLDLFDVKLGFTLQSKMDRPEIRRRAEERLALVRGRMYELAQEILSEEGPTATLPETPSEEVQQETIQAALDVVYRVRPERGGIVDTAKRSLAQATQFAAENGIVTVPSDPVEIIVMPEFQRGVSLAYCDSPGPLDKGQMTFYAVSPLPEDWTPEQDESFLKEYNDMSVQVLTIHEAVPGHYLQLAHANAYPSPLRAVLSSGPLSRAGPSIPKG